MSDKREKVLILGKSASGKNFLAEYLESKGLKRCVTYTTRPKRDNEKEGIDYNYISESEFKSMINEGKMQEWASFIGWYYGTTNEDFDNNQVFIKTVSGLKQIPDEVRNKCFVVFIDTPIENRRERLLERKDNNDSIDRRISADEEDFKDFNDYDLRITDPDFDPDLVYCLMD